MTQSPNRVEMIVRRIFIGAVAFWAIYLVVSLVSGDRLGQLIAGIGLVLTVLQLWAQSRASHGN